MNHLSIKPRRIAQLCGALRSNISESKIILDRTTAFNPAKFIGRGWTVWKGPANGNGFEGAEEHDQRSLALTTLDVTRLRLETAIKKGETSIIGEEKLARLQKMPDVIRLDLGIFQTFWRNQHFIPERFKAQTNGDITYILCDGSVLRGPGGYRFVLCFCRRGGRWRWYCFRLDEFLFVSCPSAVYTQVGTQN